MGFLIFFGVTIFFTLIFVLSNKEREKTDTIESRELRAAQKESELVRKETERNLILHNKNEEIKKLLDNRESEKYGIEKKEKELKRREEEIKNRESALHDKVINDINTLLTDKAKSYKWLAGMMADYMTIKETEFYMEYGLGYKNIKEHDRAININELRKEKRQLIEENKILKYELEYIKNVIPDAEDFIEYDEMGTDTSSEDFIYNFISKEEYSKLSEIEKNKRALEYYKKRKRTNWEIGRDFERYIGYVFEKDMGATVEYFGMEKGKKDLGRDLIVQTVNTIIIVQCKYWSQKKVIHEKHITQLFGTFYKYKLEHPNEQRKIEAMFVTHTKLSDVAKTFADALNISVVEDVNEGDYPIIKCHHGVDQDGFQTKIYHLPMDQQYDKTIINTKNGDFWAISVEQAENKGYRRAHKWHP